MSPTSDTSAEPLHLVEEQVEVTKREVETGRVSVRTVVDEREEMIGETLRHQGLSVERRAVERRVDAAPPPREEGDATIVSVVEERLVVSRQLFVVEEVIVRRTETVEQVAIPVVLRSMRAVVDRHDADHHNPEEERV